MKEPRKLMNEISPLMSISYCFANLNAIGGQIMYLRFGLETGGPVIMLWGYLLLGTLSIVTGNKGIFIWIINVR